MNLNNATFIRENGEFVITIKDSANDCSDKYCYFCEKTLGNQNGKVETKSTVCAINITESELFFEEDNSTRKFSFISEKHLPQIIEYIIGKYYDDNSVCRHCYKSALEMLKARSKIIIDLIVDNDFRNCNDVYFAYFAYYISEDIEDAIGMALQKAKNDIEFCRNAKLLSNIDRVIHEISSDDYLIELDSVDFDSLLLDMTVTKLSKKIANFKKDKNENIYYESRNFAVLSRSNLR